MIPALPDEQDSPSPGSGGNGNGYFEHPEPEPMPVPIAVPASSGPQQAVLGRHGELQIIQVEKEDTFSLSSKSGGQVDGGCCFANATFLVGNGNDHSLHYAILTFV